MKNNNDTKTIKQEKCHAFQPWVLGLLIIQVIASIFIIFQLSNIDNSNTQNEKIANIEKKVNSIDGFFKTNIPGYDSTGSNAPSNPGSNADAPSQKIEITADDDPFLGNINAKVEVIEFSDYQCPFCRKYWAESYPQLKKDFIDTGKIKYVFRDFPLNFHPSAPLAAVAANCVREQKGNEGYFKFHDIAFTEQAKLGSGTVQFTEEDIFLWVNQIEGIDQTKFNTCYNDPAQIAEVEKDLADGAKAGVSGTPSFFINGKLIVGAQPYSVLKTEIENALNQ